MAADGSPSGAARRMLRFFGRSMFLGVGGLMSSIPILALDIHVHADTTFMLSWAGVCVVWTLLGMVARTMRP